MRTEWGRSRDTHYQWVCATGGGVRAVIQRPYCRYPQCSCPREQRGAADCRANGYYGLIVGPDGLVQDIEIDGPVSLTAAQNETERALRAAGWEAKDAEETA